MVLISLLLTWRVAREEYHGRKSGGSGWLTLGRMFIGAIFSLITAVVAGFFGGVGAFFGYLAIQVVVTTVLPVYLVARESSKIARSK